MVEIKNIKKVYDNNIAVNNLSLNIDKGEIVGLLGPNGAGKSTTMKIVAGLIIPDDGDVIVNGKSVKNSPLYTKRKIGFMPESNPLYKDMLVKEAIEYSLNLSGVKRNLRKERIDYVVKATNLEKVFYRPISELSKGFKQRVGLAQVLAPDPEILILDEPTEGLDPNQRNEIRNLIKELGKNKTVIISTHVLQEVELMCNRIIIVNKGEIVKDGVKEDFIKDELNNTTILIKIRSSFKPSLNLNATQIKLTGVESNIYSFEIKGGNLTKLIQDINRAVKSSDWEIFELKSQNQNLEEIFRNLTLEN
jgi:ABC-2 type transport system ATP-binding protein